MALFYRLLPSALKIEFSRINLSDSTIKLLCLNPDQAKAYRKLFNESGNVWIVVDEAGSMKSVNLAKLQ